MTDFLKMYTTKDLEKVVADRKAAEAELNKPVPLKNPDYRSILASAIKHIDYVASDDYCDDNDEEHYMYEDVMKAIFGNNVMDWISKHG